MAVGDSDSAPPGIPYQSRRPVRSHRHSAQALLREERPTRHLDLPGGLLQGGYLSCRGTSGHLDDFKELFGLARIYGGIHYRTTIEVSWTQGEAIAQNVIDHFYTRRALDGRDDDDDEDERNDGRRRER